jgi:predicted transcriptional regulator
MEVRFTSDQETKLTELALRTGRGTDELLQEAVDHLLEYNVWFEQKVSASIAQADRGELIDHNDVRARVVKRLQEKQP